MATAAEDLSGENAPDPNAEDPNAVVEEGEEQPSPYDNLAQKMGWVPKEQYRGDPEKWKPAEDFILAGRDIQRSLSTELKGLRETVEVIGKTSASIVEQQVESRTKEALERFNQAVEDGDSKAALAASTDLAKLSAPKTATNQPTAEASSWASKNASWFQKDALATAEAFRVCNDLAGLGYSQADQLAAAEAKVKKDFPHLFPQAKQQAGVNAPGSRTAAPANRAKAFSDMPKAAQDVANGMVERGVIPDREAYAKNYWANAERKA